MQIKMDWKSELKRAASNPANRHKFVIVRFSTDDYMKNDGGRIMMYDSYLQAVETCSIQELEDVWIIPLGNYAK